jgi:lysophospholipase
MEPAPFFDDITTGPDGGQAWWIKARDGVRLRVALWPLKKAKGTVLLFPGRTEYIEKYGPTARDLAACGYATLTIDWRGQGLADRLVANPMAGHVQNFTDYQMDVAAMLEAAEKLDLPKPYHLLAHSMGGCIALRSLHEGLPVQTATFSAPMFRIGMAAYMRPFAWAMSWGSRFVGLGHKIAPGTSRESYVLVEPFETNMLTTDRDMYQNLIDQTRAQPGLGLAGPSLRWLYMSLVEGRALARMTSPDVPCLTLLGSDEEIVDVPAIKERMAHWPSSRFEIIEGGKHELLMDTPETRARVMDMICDHMAR